MGRREEVLEAAISVLAESGTRGLTHGATDRVAGVPRGTTSNYFRTRDALLQGIVRALNEVFIDGIARNEVPRDRDELVARLAAGVEHATDPELPNGIAFFMLNYEAATNSEIADLLIQAMRRLERVMSSWLEALGSTSPERDAIVLGQYMRGIMVNQRTMRQPDLDLAAALDPMVRTLLRD